MTEFLYVYRFSGRPEPERSEERMQQWRVWMKDLADKGHLKEAGNPLELTGKVVSGKPKAITDGPYAETKDIIGGYSIVLAKDLAQAAELSQGCPILAAGGLVEVRPIQKIGA